VSRARQFLRSEMQERYRQVRDQTVRLCQPLAIEDYVVQSCDDMSPPKWHLGHTAWFFERLLLGRSVLTERREIEAIVRYRYRGHSQGALISALHKALEAVDQSPLVLGEAAGPLPSARPDATVEPRG